MLHAGAQRQLKAVAQAAQIDGKRAVAIHADAGAPQLALMDLRYLPTNVRPAWELRS